MIWLIENRLFCDSTLCISVAQRKGSTTSEISPKWRNSPMKVLTVFPCPPPTYRWWQAGLAPPITSSFSAKMDGQSLLQRSIRMVLGRWSSKVFWYFVSGSKKQTEKCFRALKSSRLALHLWVYVGGIVTRDSMPEPFAVSQNKYTRIPGAPNYVFNHCFFMIAALLHAQCQVWERRNPTTKHACFWLALSNVRTL